VTISAEYLAQQQELHKNPNYGVASLQYAPIVADMVRQLGLKSIADYGAGKCNLRKKLHEMNCKAFDYHPYDPAFPEYGKPTQADLVCCIDVLEHIEPLYLDAVLKELEKITISYAIFTIHTGPAQKTLSDGRNAHLIQKPASWWLPKLCRHFEIRQLQETPGGFWLALTPLATGEARQET